MINPTTPSFGNRLNVVKANADGTYPSYAIVGVLTEDIADNNEGFATWFGYVRNLNENDLETRNIKPVSETWAVGDILWANPNLNGGYTNVEPNSNNLKVPVASITSINGVNITLLVRPTLTPSLRDLSNVSISAATNGDLLSYDSVQDLWKSNKTLDGSYDVTGSLSATTFYGDGSNLTGINDNYTTGATLNNTVISFDRNDLLDAYSVDIKPALNDYLPLNITGDTSVSIDDAITLTISGSDNSKIYNYIQHGDSDDLYNGLFLDKSNAVIFNQDSSSTDIFAVSASALGGARLSYGDSGGTITSMYINKSSAKVESSISTFNGLEYGADYSANYTNRSLVDKEYVDGAISNTFTGYTYVTEDIVNEIFDTEIVSSGNIKTKFILDPNANDIGTGMYVEDLTNGFVSQVYLDSTSQQQSLFDSTLAIYQSNIESSYTNVFGSENVTITLQTANLQSASLSQIRLNTDLIADTSEISIFSDDIILTGDILLDGSSTLDGTVTLTTVGTTTPVNNLAVDSNGDIVEGTDTYVTGGTYTSATDTLRFTRNDGGQFSVTGVTKDVPYDISFAISDETTAITTGTAKLTFFAPRAFTITNVYASLSTAGSTNSVFDINVNGSSILSTKITVESSEKHSKDATTQPVISNTSIAQFDEITIDIDTAGTDAKGAKIYITGTITV
jgi:hypothetical protein